MNVEVLVAIGIGNWEWEGFEWDRPTGQGPPLHERQDVPELHCAKLQGHRYR